MAERFAGDINIHIHRYRLLAGVAADGEPMIVQAAIWRNQAHVSRGAFGSLLHTQEPIIAGAQIVEQIPAQRAENT